MISTKRWLKVQTNSNSVEWAVSTSFLDEIAQMYIFPKVMWKNNNLGIAKLDDLWK